MTDQDISLESLIQEGRVVLKQDDPEVAHRAFYQWDQSVAQWLDDKYPDTGFSAEWSSLSASTLVMGHYYQNSPSAWKVFKEGVTKRLAWLSNLAKQEFLQATQGFIISGKQPVSNKVFIVHGHNEALKDKVARFVERLDLEPIILHEQPNRGRTIIEKLIEYSDVSFAIVLLTADDKGGPIDADLSAFGARARQNVILELGLFLGKLGRERVCALYESGVEIPSDYQGVLFVPLGDNDSWTVRLGRELRTANLPVDLNKLA
jgi:predicted nucleotide-binding protein